jgi:hypothetical protein
MCTSSSIANLSSTPITIQAREKPSSVTVPPQSGSKSGRPEIRRDERRPRKADNTLTNSRKPDEGSDESKDAAKPSNGDEKFRSRQTSAAIKILSKSLVLNGDALGKLMRDDHNYTIIGVLGQEGSGKSFVLDAFARSASQMDSPPVFLSQSEDQVLSQSHCTIGIDAFVTPERLILLDTQPVQSASVLSNLLTGDIPLSKSENPLDVFEMHSLQLCIFLLSVCHVVLVVGEWSRAPHFFRLLRTAMILKKSLGTSSFACTSSQSRGLDSHSASYRHEIIPTVYQSMEEAEVIWVCCI